MNTWYLLNETEPRPATENMACDQYLLELVDAGLLRQPVLRIYRWQNSSLSLGYHQQWRDTVDLNALEAEGITLVRRWTGGRAVLHDRDEITYSVIAPMKEPFQRRVSHNYCLIGKALERFTNLDNAKGTLVAESEDITTIRQKRHLPCFASMSQSEIESKGRKLIGSAQKLGKEGFLQHGSIPMHHRLDVLKKITATDEDMSALMRGMIDLYRDAGLALPEPTALADRLVHAFAETFQSHFVDLKHQSFYQEDEVRRIASERFGTDAWTFRK